MDEIIIGICEDSEADKKELIGHLNAAGQELGIHMNIRAYSSGKDFLKHYSLAYQMVLLDARLPDMDSREAAARLREKSQNVYLVFFSRSHEMATIGYRYRAANFLYKPFRYADILAEIRHFQSNYWSYVASESMLLSGRDGDYNVQASLIRYIETDGRHQILHYDGKKLETNGKLSDYENRLPKRHFYRCHNSYIVNLRYIDIIKRDHFRYSILLVTGETIPLSRDRRDGLSQLLNHMDV